MSIFALNREKNQERSIGYARPILRTTFKNSYSNPFSRSHFLIISGGSCMSSLSSITSFLAVALEFTGQSIHWFLTMSDEKSLFVKRAKKQAIMLKGPRHLWKLFLCLGWGLRCLGPHAWLPTTVTKSNFQLIIHREKQSPHFHNLIASPHRPVIGF